MALRHPLFPNTAAAVGARDAGRNYTSDGNFVEICVVPIATAIQLSAWLIIVKRAVVPIAMQPRYCHVFCARLCCWGVL